MIGAQIVSALQTIVSRETDPLASVVVTVGTFNAGSAPNVIPDTATLTGTVRTLDQSVRERTAERMATLVGGVATALGGSATLDYRWGYPALVNDTDMAQLVLETAAEVVGPDNVVVIPPSMPGEDMSYFLQRVPGCMFVVGSMNEERGLIWGHHHPRFDIDEASMAIGVEMMTSVVMRYFAQA